MKEKIKGIFTRADDKTRMRYLLAKDDIDDIKAALMIVFHHIIDAIPEEVQITAHSDRIEISSISEQFYTEVVINLAEEQLLMRYNEQSSLELFSKAKECDMELIDRLRNIFCVLGFYKIGEFRVNTGKVQWKNESYKINVIRRKL